MTDVKIRFWHHVNITNECWLWIGCINNKGYGKIFIDKVRTIYAHRLSYIIHHGSIKQKMFVCHTCDNPACVNPDHLYLGNNTDNMQDCSRKNRTTFGTKSANAKLTEKDVIYIKKNYTPYKIPMSFFANKFKVNEETVRNIIIGRTWRRVTV